MSNCAHFQLSTLNSTLIPVPKRAVNFGKQFAIGRVQSVAAAGGGVEPRPSVRWDGLPGRRSHISTTQWALGLISTVRIGAGAWRKSANTKTSGDTDRARTKLHDAPSGTRERKDQREKAFRKQIFGTESRRQRRLPRAATTHRWRARLRSTPLRSARPTSTKGKNLKT